MRLSAHEFELLVARALDRLPPAFGVLLDNIVVVVEPEPSEDELRDLGIDPADPERDEILGLYHGIPLTERDSAFADLPDRILIYSGPISRCCSSRSEIIQEIRDTVVHELGHHFGLSDDEMPY